MNTKLKTKIETTPARAVLADAIELLKQAERRRGVIDAAIERAGRIITEAEEKFAKAQEAVAGAKEAHAKQIAFGAEHGAVTLSDPALRAARADELAAEDELDAARRALDHLKGQIVTEKNLYGVPMDPVSVAQRAVDAAVKGVFTESAEVETYIGDTIKLQAELCGRRQVIADLMKNRLLNDEAAAEARVLMFDFRLPQWVDGAAEFNIEERHPAVVPWRAARDALRGNADAPLPA